MQVALAGVIVAVAVVLGVYVTPGVSVIVGELVNVPTGVRVE
ncbi:MAG: hypothetical protein NT020_09070 [Chloroflexales bacterium]|nr:hypothetical protein [Chloroflexales bacterium]